jgi:D-alanyl-D-alanine carboxypeptidase
MTRFARPGLQDDTIARGGASRALQGLRTGLFAALGALGMMALTPKPAALADGPGPTTPGVSAILMNATTGTILAESNADTPRYPASLTKLMTLDLAFQALRDHRMTLDTMMPVSEHAASVEPVKLGLRPGSMISVQNAILAMVTMSANDAATVLGEYLGGGSESRFAQMMTLRAHALGMDATTFDNASGLPDPDQVTTAHDLVILARDIVLDYPEDRHFFATESFMFGDRRIASNNQMLKLYPGATGMKTGYTFLARHNLVTSAERNGQILIGVVLHDASWSGAYAHMTAMLNRGFGDLTVASLPTLIPRAEAATPTTIAAAPAEPAPIHTASTEASHTLRTAWTAQLGAFSSMQAAKRVLVSAHERHPEGVGRIGALPTSHGGTLWTAQLTGLSERAAWTVCRTRKRDRRPCLVIAPNHDEIASR